MAENNVWVIIGILVVVGIIFGPKLGLFSIAPGPLGIFDASDGKVYFIDVSESSGSARASVEPDSPEGGKTNRFWQNTEGSSKITTKIVSLDMRRISTVVFEGKSYGWISGPGCPYTFVVGLTDGLSSVELAKVERTAVQFKKEAWENIIVTRTSTGYETWVGPGFKATDNSLLTKFNTNSPWDITLTSISTCDSNTKSGFIIKDIKQLTTAPTNGKLQEFTYTSGTLWYESGEFEITGPIPTIDGSYLETSYEGKNYVITQSALFSIPRIATGKVVFKVFEQAVGCVPSCGRQGAEAGDLLWDRAITGGKEREIFYLTTGSVGPQEIPITDGWNKIEMQRQDKGAKFFKNDNLLVEQTTEASVAIQTINLLGISGRPGAKSAYDDIGIFTSWAIPSAPTVAESTTKLDLTLTQQPTPPTTPTNQTNQTTTTTTNQTQVTQVQPSGVVPSTGTTPVQTQQVTQIPTKTNIFANVNLVAFAILAILAFGIYQLARKD